MQSNLVPVIKPMSAPEFLSRWMPYFFPAFKPGDHGYRERCCQLLAIATARKSTSLQRYATNNFADFPAELLHVLAAVDFSFYVVKTSHELDKVINTTFEMIDPGDLSMVQYQLKKLTR